MALDVIEPLCSQAAVLRLFSTNAVNVRIDDALEVQRLIRSGTPTGGTFVISYDSVSSTSIAYNADQYALQKALRTIFALANIEVFKTEGTSPDLTHWVRFVDVTGDASTLVLATNSLTGGSSPTVTIATLQTGSSTSIEDARIMATEEILKYAFKHYSPTRLAQSNLCERWATWIACYYLAGRTGDDPPKVFCQEYIEIKKQLMMVLTGALDIPGIPKRRASAPTWTNQSANPQYSYRVLRKLKGLSSKTPATTRVTPTDYQETFSGDFEI